VYTLTVTPSIPFWDSGEYIATSFILGIPHPPGTPLYVLIGRLLPCTTASGLCTNCSQARAPAIRGRIRCLSRSVFHDLVLAILPFRGRERMSEVRLQDSVPRATAGVVGGDRARSATGRVGGGLRRPAQRVRRRDQAVGLDRPAPHQLAAPSGSRRADALAIAVAGVEAVSPQVLMPRVADAVRRASRPNGGRLHVIAVGKAAAVWGALDPRSDPGLAAGLDDVRVERALDEEPDVPRGLCATGIRPGGFRSSPDSRCSAKVAPYRSSSVNQKATPSVKKC